jgi:S1-C subfamily serine protease
MCPTCRARIIVVARGEQLAFEATFVAQSCPRPPPIEPPKAAVARSYAPGTLVAANFAAAGTIGLSLASRVDAHGHETVYVSRVDAGSPADEQGVPTQADVVQVNGQSLAHTPMRRVQLAELAAHRPFALVVRVPLAPVPAGHPPSVGAAAPAASTPGATAYAASAPPPAASAAPAVTTGGSRGFARRQSPRRQSSPRPQRSSSPFRRMLGR